MTYSPADLRSWEFLRAEVIGDLPLLLDFGLSDGVLDPQLWWDDFLDKEVEEVSLALQALGDPPENL